MYRYFHGSDRNSIPSGLPSRLVDPTLRVLGEQPQFLRIGEGNHPKNELLRKVYQTPSKDVVRTRVLNELFPPTKTDPYFNRADNIVALRKASEELGIPLENTGLRIATYPLRIEGDVADVNLLAKITNKAASNLNQAGQPVLANALTRKAKFFNQPTIYSELAVDGTEDVEAILEAYNKAEPRRTASSQGNRPILVQADGLDPNIGIPTGSPENIPWDNVEGMRGSNAYKPADEIKRPRFIDLGHGVYTRQGERINAEQKNLLDTGMADLEDRSFILQPQERAMASPLPVEYFFSKDDWPESKGLPIGSIVGNQEPVRALASRLPVNYYGAERDIPTGVDAIIRGFGRRNPKTGLLEGNVNAQGYLQTDLPANYYGIPRDIPTSLRADYGRTGRRGLTPTRDELPLTGEIGSVIGSQPNREQYRPTTRLGLQTLGLNTQFGREIITPAVVKGDVLYPSNTTIVQRTVPINRLTDDLSNRVLRGEVDLQNYEPFKSNRNTYGARDTKTPWREYYSDPFVYEDKGLDGEVNRLMRAINEAPAQLENALSNQALANRKAMELETAIQSFKRIARGGKKADISMSPEMMIELAEVAPRIREWKSQRRGNEVAAAKAQDRIAELRASQELLGIEYMVKPKKWGEDVLSGYRIGSDTIGGVRDSNEIPVNDKFSEEVFDKLIVSQDPLLVEGKPVRRAAKPNGWTIKPNAVQMWREALQQEALDNRRDYDIATLFGFTGSY